MAKYYGKIGYGESKEITPGRWDDVITERVYFGDVTRNALEVRAEDQVNSNLTTSNSFSIMADAYAYEHFFAMRYIQWAGALWAIKQVEVRRPRLIIRIGGVYNGPTPTVEPDTD